MSRKPLARSLLSRACRRQYRTWRRIAARRSQGTPTEGRWLLEENLRKGNADTKDSAPDRSLGLSGYVSGWTSTDQVRECAIATGQISWLGFVDPDLDGQARRMAPTRNAKFDGMAVSAMRADPDC